MPDKTRLEQLAAELEASGEYVILRRIPVPEPLPAPEGAEVRRGLFIDVETTGLRPDSDDIIELAMVPFDYDRLTGQVLEVFEPFSALNDPGRSIPRAVVELTGITDDDVRGQSIDRTEMARVVNESDLLIAHNAGFDRPFVERFDDVFAAKPWACTVADINWAAEGVRGAKLDYLAMSYGFFFQSHRASEDCIAAVSLLAQPLPRSGVPALANLLANASRSTWRFEATGAPFEAKDLLKARGYRWNAGARFWWRDVPDERRQEEHDWLASEVFKRKPVPEPRQFTAYDRYSRRDS